MSVALNPGPGFHPGVPTALFQTRIFEPYSADQVGYIWNWNYDVAPEGQRFLISTPESGRPAPTTTVVLNWLARLPRP
jgi:hypothetical protein